MKKRQTMNKNLSHVKNMETLREEILAAKAGIKTQEKELTERWKRLPAETIKSAAGAMATTFLSKKIAVKGFLVVKAAAQNFFSKNEDLKTKSKGEIFSSGKKIGLYIAMGFFLNWLKKK